jgi:hypothetical protein
MFTRRAFLLGLFATALSPQLALAAKDKAAKKPDRDKKLPPKPATGPRSLVRQAWPPSIIPDYIGVGEKGYAVIGDTGGRLVVVDLKQEDAPKVISELGNIGKRVAAMSIQMQRAYAISWQEKGLEGDWALSVISLMPATDPTVLAQMPLSYFSDPSSLAAFGDTIAVSGSGLNGENQVIIYGASKGKRAEPSQLSAITCDRPITQIVLQDKNLIVVQSGHHETQIEVVGLINPRNPTRGKAVRLKGNYQVVAKCRDFFLVGGTNLEKDYEIHSVAFKPAPRVVRGLRLPGVSDILDGAAQKTQMLLLVNHNGRQAVLPVSFNKQLQLVASNVVLLPSGKHGPASKARIATTPKEAYVASDWGGVQVLTAQDGGWQYMYSHAIPRLPAAAVALSGSRAILGGADLKVYDLEKPDRPLLLESADVGSPIKSLVGLGKQLVVLSRDGLSMRTLKHPTECWVSLKMAGTALTYDPEKKCAYVLSGKNEKVTTVNRIEITMDDLKVDKTMEIGSGFRRASALDGKLLVAAVNDLTLFEIGDGAEQIGTRNFTNLAMRDIYLGESQAVITAIDQNSRGFLLVVDTEQAGLPTVGSIPLPHDGAALAVAGAKVISVGSTGDGKDLATLVDIVKPEEPKIITSLQVVDAASAVSIRGNLAVVVGRGLEVIALS